MTSDRDKALAKIREILENGPRGDLAAAVERLKAERRKGRCPQRDVVQIGDVTIWMDREVR